MRTDTIIMQNIAHAAMQTMCLRLLDLATWRHHGIGVLQGYIQEHTEPEVRLHIWSKKLLKPGIDVSGDIHDHRFDMTSHVLLGTVQHEEILPTADDEFGDHQMFALTHARAAADNNFHGPITQLGGSYSLERCKHEINEGWSYFYPALNFHRSPLVGDKVAVTIVEKHNQKVTPARVLYPISTPPVMAFGHEMDDNLVKEVIAEARAGLLEGQQS